jgi:hypothetical protein
MCGIPTGVVVAAVPLVTVCDGESATRSFVIASENGMLHLRGNES